MKSLFASATVFYCWQSVLSVLFWMDEYVALNSRQHTFISKLHNSCIILYIWTIKADMSKWHLFSTFQGSLSLSALEVVSNTHISMSTIKQRGQCRCSVICAVLSCSGNSGVYQWRLLSLLMRDIKQTDQIYINNAQAFHYAQSFWCFHRECRNCGS